MNLVENAVDAVDGRRGRGAARPTAVLVTLHVRRMRRSVKLTVKDNGPGIPEELRERVFEPFFTSKAGGSGLGLYLVREIAIASGGTMTLSSTDRPRNVGVDPLAVRRSRASTMTACAESDTSRTRAPRWPSLALGKDESYHRGGPCCIMCAPCVRAGGRVAVTTDAVPVILIVDDDRNGRESLRRALLRDGYEVLTAENGKTALAVAQDHALDLVLTDLIMPGLDGLDFLEGLRVVQPEVPAILISAFANVDTAVKAVRRGVQDVLEKPIRLRDVRRAVKRVIARRPVAAARLREPDRRHGRPTTAAFGSRQLVGRSPAFLEVLDVVDRVAPVSSTVLLLGESGTGKELIAEAIHARSARANGPLVKVACAALAEGVLEAELFGSEKGAYTGAHELRKGRFEIAHRGTLFLDEIGELSLALQVKLLRVLQEGEFERVGGSETLRTDVRVIAATNRDLEAMVQRRTLPGGPLLAAQRDRDPRPAPARAARGHRPPRRALP